METGFAPRFAEDVLGVIRVIGPFAQEASRTPRGCDPLPELSAISLSRDPVKGTFVKGHPRLSEALLVDRARLLTLTAPRRRFYSAGCGPLNADFGQTKHGVFTNRP